MNKKLVCIFVFLFLSLVIISACELVEDRVAGRRVRSSYFNCTDTDGGWNYIVAGTVNLDHLTRGNRTRIDYCRDENRLLEQNCRSDSRMSNRVIYCDREFGEDFSCIKGRCVNSTCYDSDGGVDIYVEGRITGFSEWENYINRTDRCSGGQVRENYCNDEGFVDRERINCPSGECRDGACVEEQDLVIELIANEFTRFTYPNRYPEIEAPEFVERFNLSRNIVLLKDLRGNFYRPDANFNNMDALQSGEEYDIKSDEDLTLYLEDVVGKPRCGTRINEEYIELNADGNREFTLDKDLNCDDGGIYFANINDVVNLDCNGYSIRGSGDSVGIHVSWEAQDVTISNCEISNFNRGVGVYYQEGRVVNLINNNIHDNINIGLEKVRAINMGNILGNRICDNGLGGINRAWRVDISCNRRGDDSNYEGNTCDRIRNCNIEQCENRC